MKRAVVRAGGVLGAAVLTLALSACSDDAGDAGDTVEPPTTATSPTATETATTQQPSPTSTPSQSQTSAPTATTTPGPTTTPAPTAAPTVPVTGSEAERLAALLPAGFPLPEELTITGDPTATSENWHVTFRVPDPADAFDFYLEALPEAGYELRPGTSDAYSPEVSSGAILASDDTHDVNLLVVDDEVEITITTR